MDATSNLAQALSRSGQPEQAIVYYQKALELRPGVAELHTQLANALVQTGRTQDAIAEYKSALQISADDMTALSNLAWLLATSSDSSLRNGAEALRAAQRANYLSGENQPVVLRILAAAYAEAGDFSNARQVARHALQLAESAHDATLVAALEKEIALYESGSSYHKTRR